MTRKCLPKNNREALGILTLFSLLTLLAVGGCRNAPELDTSLMTHDPCAPPCWQFIIPGESSEDDVRSRLEGNPLVRTATLQYGPTEQTGVSLTVFSWEAQGRQPNRIYLLDGRVLRIEVQVDYELTLGEIVEKYGPPETIYAYLRCTEFCGYLVSFDYSSLGMRLSSFSHPVNYDDFVLEEGVGLLSEALFVTHVVYYAPTPLSDLLSDVLLLPPEGVDYHMANAQEWQGFGSVELAR